MQSPHCHSSHQPCLSEPHCPHLGRGCHGSRSAELLWGGSCSAELQTDETQPCLSTVNISVLTSGLEEGTPKTLSASFVPGPPYSAVSLPSQPAREEAFPCWVGVDCGPRKGNRDQLVLYLSPPSGVNSGYRQPWLKEHTIPLHG